MPFVAIFDQDQLLFRFNGAYPELCTEVLPKVFPSILTVKLETNYRSSQEIIARQRRSIARNYSNMGGPYNQDLFKNLTHRKDAPAGDIIKFDMFDFQEEESEYIAASIDEMITTGEYAPGDFFIGTRTRSQLSYIEGSLTQHEIKYINLAGGCFWSAKHVQDIIAYARLAYQVLLWRSSGTDAEHKYDKNEADEALKRVYNIASKWFRAPFGSQKGTYINHRYLGRAFLDSIEGTYEQIRFVGWKHEKAANDLVALVKEIGVELEQSGVAGALKHVVDNCYAQWLAAEEGLLTIDESENGKIDDLISVIEIASKFSDPSKFFEYVANMQSAAKKAAADKDHTKYVVISTIHRLKGKERGVVFGAGICESCGGKPGGLLPHTFSLTQPPNFGVLPTGGMSRVEDERCIFFVLISRAKELVFLSGFRNYRDFEFGPSRFIEEIGISEKVYGAKAEEDKPPW